MKTKKRRLKKSVRKTIAALLMVTALIIAAIPGQNINASSEGGEEGLTGAGGYSVEYHADDGIIYRINSSGYLADYTNETSPLDGMIYQSKDEIKTLRIPDVYYTTPDKSDEPKQIKGIAANALKDCVNLQQVVLPSACMEVCDKAMAGCTNLRSVTTNAALNWIGESAFDGDVNLSTFSFPASLSNIGIYAFRNTNLSSVSIPNGNMNRIEDGTFSGCTNLNNVSIGNSITSIGSEAFMDCTKLQNVSLPQNLTTLKTAAFKNCSALRSITFPSNLRELGTYVFDGCTSMTGISFAQDSTLDTLPQGTFRNCSRLNTVELPECIDDINSSAFEGCTGLEYVTLPKGLASLSPSTFEDCKNLICLTVPGDTQMGVTNAFSNMQNGDFRIKGNIEDDCYRYAKAFNICFETMDGQFEKECFRVNSNGDLTYADMNTLLLTSNYVTIPEKIGDIPVKSITSSVNVFKGNGNLVGVVIPDSVTSIAPDAFNGCSRLSRAVISSLNTGIGANAFKDVASDFIMYGTIDRDSKPFNYAMDNEIPFVNEDTYFKAERDPETNLNVLTDYDETASSLVIPSGIDAFGVKSDGSYSASIFDGNETLTSIVITDASKIKDHEFKNCTNLSQVSIPSTVKTMGKAPFYGCNRLSDVDIEAANTHFDCENGVLYGLTGGTRTKIIELLGGSQGNANFSIPSSVNELAEEAFAGVDNLSQITFSDGVNIIPDSCFKDSSVVIANLSPAVKRIDENAFANTRIAEIHIPKETTYISDTATNGVTGLTVYGVYGTTAENFADKFHYTFIGEENQGGESSSSSSDGSNTNAPGGSSAKTSTSSKKSSSSKKASNSSSKKTTSSSKKSSSSSSSSSSSTSSSSTVVKTSGNAATAAAGNTTTAGNAGNAHVNADNSGLDNKNLVSGSIEGTTDNYVIKITQDQQATEAFENALKKKYGQLDNLRYYPMDISLYDSAGVNKIEDPKGVSVTITIPIPEELALYGGNNHAAAVKDNSLEELGTRFSSIDGVPCVTFTATHFSPYGLYVDVTNLSAGDMLDSSPKTGDPIHPKWFLVIGLVALSLLMFFKRDPVVAKKQAV